jgi:hypothetical protein
MASVSFDTKGSNGPQCPRSRPLICQPNVRSHFPSSYTYKTSGATHNLSTLTQVRYWIVFASPLKHTQSVHLDKAGGRGKPVLQPFRKGVSNKGWGLRWRNRSRYLAGSRQVALSAPGDALDIFSRRNEPGAFQVSAMNDVTSTKSNSLKQKRPSIQGCTSTGDSPGTNTSSPKGNN